MRLLIKGALLFSLIIAMARPVSAGEGGDAAKGEELFKRECLVCHYDPTQDKSWSGPSLYKLYNRPACVRPNVFCSSALRSANITWTDEKLDAWLRSPAAMVPNNRMFMIGISNPQDRADIIAYLKKSSQ